ncbi:MAG TPA: hypothetical protein VEB61_09715, partial [Candidatus Binatia bacterium]|nr:hypothetical protein [Candidatus Binatia bacterium]
MHKIEDLGCFVLPTRNRVSRNALDHGLRPLRDSIIVASLKRRIKDKREVASLAIMTNILVIEEGHDLRAAIEMAGHDSVSVRSVESISAALDQHVGAEY